MKKEFVPQLVSVWREGYRLPHFMGDLTAGVITGIVALPLAIAFAVASGVTPQQGLYTAVVAGFIISLLGGSRVQIGGPTGAFIVVVYGIIQKHGIDGLMMATLMAGFLLLAMGLLRLGSIIKYIPYPVTVGFTSGIAVIIGVTQLRDLFGLSMAKVPAEFVEKLSAYVASRETWNPWALTVGGGTLLILVFWPRISTRLPASLVAIVACTLAVKFFNLPVETIGSRFGQIPSGLPSLALPHFEFAQLSELFPAAASIAMLGAIESLLSAVVADGMTGGRHRSNMELVAQGVANIASPLVGGIPATGAIARTATNIKNGARTPVAGMVHAVVLLLILVCLGPLAALIPMATLAGILLGVAFKMSEYRLFMKMFRAPKSDISVMVGTFALTVLLDLTVAIPTGMVMASFLFMRRMEQVSGAAFVDQDEGDDDDERCDPFALARFSVPKGVEVFEINGPFFFGAASKFQDALINRKPRVLILRMRKVPAMDATGLFALEDIVNRAFALGREVVISGIHPQPLSVLEKAGLAQRVGAERICRNIELALARAEELLLAKQAEGKAAAGVTPQPAPSEA